MKVKYRISGRASALAILSSISGAVFAQTASSDQKLEEVIVTGQRRALLDSIATKQNTDLVSDSISTAEIGQLPDVTIAEELNRLPGVNTTRDRGNASQASIRGLGPRLVLGLVNGREVASSEPSQDLRWEIYPSEVLSGAQIYKAQDASLVPGGIAATVDIRTLSPLDYRGPSFSVRAGPTYNEEGKDMPHYNGLGYRGSAGYIGHINDDFAVSLAGSVQREKNGFPDFRSWGWNTPYNTGGTTGPFHTGDLNGDGKPDNTTYGLNTELKEVTQDRYALAGAAGWRASDDL
ncbi:MAG TPA: TonB-dependent receptor plug domain-containing protein, partial [Steroidobacteraceae bacterium]|nr:TonB-dependent receptor plug domain-containing protein [Steroidobacteraceae bacterium]